MNKYLMGIHRFCNGYETFEIEAENKQDAKEKASIFVRQNWKYDGGNYDLNDIKCIKKINQKKGTQ